MPPEPRHLSEFPVTRFGRPLSLARSILISLLLFVLAAAAFFILRPASPEREIAALSRQLTHPVGKLHKLHAALWTRLPQFVRANTSSFAPANPQLLQLAAVETLHARAPQSHQAVAALVSALDDRMLAPHAIAALCEIGPCAVDSVAKLAEMAGRAGAAPPNISDKALRALGTIAPNDHRVISLLFSKARQNDFQSWTAFSVMEQCAPFYDETARDKLLALAAENIALRQPALRIAARVQPQSARTGALLLDLLRDPEPGLKLVAVEVLAERSSPVFQAEILAQIKDILTAFENDLIEEPPRVPHTASWLSPRPPFGSASLEALSICALGRIGSSGAPQVPALLRRLSHRSYPVRFEAALALYRIEGQFSHLREILQAALSDGSPPIRSEAARLLCQLAPESPPDTVPLLRRALNDPDKHIRLAAARALQELGPNAAEALPDLHQLLFDPSPGVRDQVTDAIAQIRARTP